MESASAIAALSYDRCVPTWLIAFQKALFPYQHVINIIKSYNNHFEVMFEVLVISYYIMMSINTPHIHKQQIWSKLCVMWIWVTQEKVIQRGYSQNNGMFNQELIAIKSGSTSVGINPLPGMPRGIQDSSSSSIRSGEAGQRKCGWETDEDIDDVEQDCDDPAEDGDDDLLIDDLTTFPLSEARNAFLEATFSKHMEKKAYENRIQQKYGTPDSRWSKFLDLDAEVVTNLPKDTVRMDVKAK